MEENPIQEEQKQFNDTHTQEIELWDKATRTTSKNDYLSFEPNRKKIVVFRDWYLTEEEVKEYGTRDDEKKFKKKTRLNVTIIEEDSISVNKQLGLYLGVSKRFLTAVKPFMRDANPSKPLRLSILKIGAKTDVQYYVEKA